MADSLSPESVWKRRLKVGMGTEGLWGGEGLRPFGLSRAVLHVHMHAHVSQSWTLLPWTSVGFSFSGFLSSSPSSLWSFSHSFSWPPLCCLPGPVVSSWFLLPSYCSQRQLKCYGRETC